MWSTIGFGVWSGVSPLVEFVRSVVLLSGVALGVVAVMVMAHVVVEKLAEVIQ